MDTTMTEVSNSQTTSGEASEDPSVPEEEGEEEEQEQKPKVMVMMADSGNWSDPSTLEKTYQTVYERPSGAVARVGKIFGFLVFFVLFAVGVLEAVPRLFRFILGIPDSNKSISDPSTVADEELVVRPPAKDAEFGTLEKNYDTIYTRPEGIRAKLGKTLGFLLFWTIFGIGVMFLVPKIFRAILGIPESS